MARWIDVPSPVIFGVRARVRRSLTALALSSIRERRQPRLGNSALAAPRSCNAIASRRASQLPATCEARRMPASFASAVSMCSTRDAAVAEHQAGLRLQHADETARVHTDRSTPRAPPSTTACSVNGARRRAAMWMPAVGTIGSNQRERSPCRCSSSIARAAPRTSCACAADAWRSRR